MPKQKIEEIINEDPVDPFSFSLKLRGWRSEEEIISLTEKYTRLYNQTGKGASSRKRPQNY